MTDDRRRREGWGRKAESLAAFALRLKGYRVLAHRRRTPAGEIDLIVRRGAAASSVSIAQRRRIILPQIPASAPSLTGLMRF